MKIKEDIKRTINIMWYIAKVYIKSIFAFWGMLFLLAIKMHKNPFVEFQKFSGKEFYLMSVNCAFVILLISLAIKFGSWLYDHPKKDSGVIVNVVTIGSTPLGVAKEMRYEGEKKGKDRTTEKSPKDKVK